MYSSGRFGIHGGSVAGRILQDQLIPGQPTFGEANDCGPGGWSRTGLVKNWAERTYSNKNQESMVYFLGHLPFFVKIHCFSMFQ